MRMATDRQVAFITKLARERNLPMIAVGNMTTANASEAIAELLAMPIPRAANPEKPVEVGIYRNDAGDIFKVQRSRQTLNLYAKRLIPIGGQRLTEDGKTVHWTFEYAAGAILNLTASMRLTLEQAKEFGIKYGVCIVCGATLVDAKSVAMGIGPVCAKRV